jgi:hypothetical protein
LAAVQITYISMLASGNYIYEFPLVITVIALVAAGGVAAILEIFRPFRHFETSLPAEDILQVKAEINKITKAGQPLVYWEIQNPVYSRVLSIIVPLIMIVVAVTAWSEVFWLSVLFAVISIAMVMIYGGFRTMVTRQAITVKMGIFGIRLLKLKTADIVSANLHNFSPLKDFGGYGIRFNKEMKAYYLRGNRGVKIKSRFNKSYLIGSDHPERLTVIINAVCCN